MKGTACNLVAKARCRAASVLTNWQMRRGVFGFSMLFVALLLAPAFAQSEQQAAPLEPGKPVERELAGGQNHAYQITLAAGQYLNLVVEQRGIDVVVALLGPDGKLIFEFDRETRRQGLETITQVAEVSGRYRLTVQAKQQGVAGGRYEIRVAELRAATEQDRALQEARRLFVEADRLWRAARYDEALPFATRSMEIRARELGPEHPDLAQSLNRLGAIHADKGDYAQAEPLYQRALQIRAQALGSAHPDVAASLADLARLYAVKGELAQAVAFQARANRSSERSLARNFASGSERQKLAYLATLSAQLDQTISLHARTAPNDPAARNEAATLILQRKGRALDALTDSLATLRRRAAPTEQALLSELQDANAQLARLVLGGPRRTTPAEHQSQIKQLEEQAEQLEAEVSRRSDQFRAQSQPITLESVQTAIPADAALLEFAVYRPFNAHYAKPGEAFGAPRYVAYVLRQLGEVQWAELGEQQAIDEAVAALRQALGDPRRTDVKRLARNVDEQVMRPLRALLGVTRRVLLAPDGALNLLPFAALVDERQRYLVTRYSFSYLTSGRDLLRLQLARASQNNPLIVADPRLWRTRRSAHAARSRTPLGGRAERRPAKPAGPRALHSAARNSRRGTGAQTDSAASDRARP